MAARRLHRKLLSAGVESNFIALARQSYKVERNESSAARSLYSRFFSAINAFLSRKLSSKTYITLFSVASVKAKNLKNFGSPNDTIFHIHNWFNLINLRELRKLLNMGYRVVFTLHDQRLFTGGCHYSLECSKFETDCKSCPILPNQVNFIPKINLKRANKVFNKFSGQFGIIAPSAWIQELARKSYLFKDQSIHLIPNVHGELTNEGYLRIKKFNGEQENKVFVGVASVEKESYLKGGLILKNIEKLLVEKKVKAEIVYLADVLKSSGKHETFWTQIDYLLVPSVLDNSPNVIHEAKILGIPVIATKVGGIGELLNLKHDYLVELNDETHYAIVQIIEKIFFENRKTSSLEIIDSYKNYVSSSIEQIKGLYANL